MQQHAEHYQKGTGVYLAVWYIRPMGVKCCNKHKHIRYVCKYTHICVCVCVRVCVEC